MALSVVHAIAFAAGLLAIVVPDGCLVAEDELAGCVDSRYRLVLFFMPYIFLFKFAYDKLREVSSEAISKRCNFSRDLAQPMLFVSSGAQISQEIIGSSRC